MIALFLGICLSLLSTSVMSYLSLATPIGPWIAPTLVLVALLLARLFSCITSRDIILAVSCGSIGGILATATAFSFPTLYFLDQTSFVCWMASPLFFSVLLGIVTFLAGAFGLIIAEWSEAMLIGIQDLPFPIGQLTHKMIATKNNIKKSYELIIGACVSVLFCLVRSIVLATKKYINTIDIVPMMLAIGFVTGHVIALPLAIGAFLTIFVLMRLHQFFFINLSYTEFVLSFCSGIVLVIAALGLFSLPMVFVSNIRGNAKKMIRYSVEQLYSKEMIISFIAVIGALCLFFSYFKMPLLAQLFLIISSIITSYVICTIAGRIGLALLGRFATFVMLPAMMLFNLNYIHLVFIAMFVEIAGGVATDVLFGRKLAQLSGISTKLVRRYQILGLCVSSVGIGMIFWLLINHFGLGSPELFAYRAQSRQLLIQVKQFNSVAMLFGGVFGLIVQKFKLNPMLVLGGLLMPVNITIGLVIGGLLALVVKESEEWYPLWSGIFVGNSLYMILRSIF